MKQYSKSILTMQETMGTRLVLLTSDGVPLAQSCDNCNGTGIVMAFVIQSGPYNAPNGTKVKWLDNLNGMRSGWYAGDMIVDTCPVCNGTGGKPQTEKYGG